VTPSLSSYFPSHSLDPSSSFTSPQKSSRRSQSKHKSGFDAARETFRSRLLTSSCMVPLAHPYSGPTVSKSCFAQLSKRSRHMIILHCSCGWKSVLIVYVEIRSEIFIFFCYAQPILCPNILLLPPANLHLASYFFWLGIRTQVLNKRF
jgi:hypothetical protein